jgi:hypothetical protein
MATTYTDILELPLMATGENNNEWNDIINNGITLAAEQAIAGMLEFTANDDTPTNIDGYRIIKVGSTNTFSVSNTAVELTSSRNGYATFWYIINETQDNMPITLTIGSASRTIPFGNNIVFYTGATVGSSSSRILYR